MEFGDSAKPGGLKQRFFRAIDPQAKADVKSDIRDTIAERRRAIEEERSKRAEIREGKRKGGIGSYIGSTIREKRQERKVRDLKEKLDPSLKKTREIDREIKGIQTRKKWRKRMTRVDNAFGTITSGFDTINIGLNKIQGFGAGGGSKKKGSDNLFGVSDKDMRELAGLGGGGPKMGGSKRKGKKSPYDIDVGF